MAVPPRALRWFVRALPPASVVGVGWLLFRGRLHGVADPSWDEVLGAALLVAGLAVAGVRRALRIGAGGTPRLRDDLELGGPLVAAAYLVVGLAGPGVHPLVYLLMAGLVGFLHAAAAALLLGLALVFEAVVTLQRQGWVDFAVHAGFLLLFAGIYRAVLNTRLALARRAEQEAVKKRIREVEERARTYRLATAGSGDAPADGSGQWLLASVKEVEGAVGAVLEIGEVAVR